MALNIVITWKRLFITFCIVIISALTVSMINNYLIISNLVSDDSYYYKSIESDYNIVKSGTGSPQLIADTCNILLFKDELRGIKHDEFEKYCGIQRNAKTINEKELVYNLYRYNRHYITPENLKKTLDYSNLGNYDMNLLFLEYNSGLDKTVSKPDYFTSRYSSLIDEKLTKSGSVNYNFIYLNDVERARYLLILPKQKQGDYNLINRVEDIKDFKNGTNVYSDELRTNISLEDAITLQKNDRNFYKFLSNDLLSNKEFVMGLIRHGKISDNSFLYFINNKLSNDLAVYNALLVNIKSHLTLMNGIIVGKELANDKQFIIQNLDNIDLSAVNHQIFDKDVLVELLMSNNKSYYYGVNMLYGTGFSERLDKDVLFALVSNPKFDMRTLYYYTIDERIDILKNFYKETNKHINAYDKCIYMHPGIDCGLEWLDSNDYNDQLDATIFRNEYIYEDVYLKDLFNPKDLTLKTGSFIYYYFICLFDILDYKSAYIADEIDTLYNDYFTE